ncbi:MAG: aminoacyl-tRNA hydrolase [Ignavibacteria bacterium]|nr:aminoacyl-tRNA hydrolase [Ignavibacteria bacterium]
MKTLIIIGMGNPGEQYAHTRHNIGFMAADAWTQGAKAPWRNRYKGLFRNMIYQEQSFRAKDTDIYIIKPQTYMNRSGDAVVQALKNIKKKTTDEQTDIIAIVDEYNFPVGRVHLRRGGSSGGHNGIESVITSLGTDDFWRLRCGIGREFGTGGLVDYVLSPFSADQKFLVPAMIERVCSSLDTIVDVGPERAMNIINSST